MKQILLNLALRLLRAALGVARPIWDDLLTKIAALDADDTAPSVKHLSADAWLATRLAVPPALRRRIIQAAVLTLRLRALLAV